LRPKTARRSKGWIAIRGECADGPFMFTNLKNGKGLPEVLHWLEHELQAPRRHH
jgi:Ni2+-binding GTPase involved in maturation of urease and hydrogenase